MTHIALIDDHGMFRYGIEEIIKNEQDYIISSSVPSVEEFLKSKSPADLLILDLSLEDGLSLNKIPLIQKMHPQIKIIALTMHNKPMLIKKTLNTAVDGYVIKQSSPMVLLEAIRIVADGGNYLDPALSESLIMLIRDFNPENEEREAGFSQLSPREQEVFSLAAEGMNNNAIAHKLYISRKTAENHRFRILKKLGLKSTAELVDFAREIGAV